jgi:alkanesulfonate monooxygenase
MVGGGGERKTLLLVARYADACNVFGGPAQVAHKYAVLREHCDAVGRPYADIERTNLQSGGLSQEVADGGRTPEALLDDLAALAEAGVQHTILGIPARGVESWIDVVGDRVIPGARAL